MKVASIVGARPQFIKVGVVSRAMRSAGITEVVIHTGQHYDERMSQIFFDELDIMRPDYDLNIGSGSHGYQTGRMLEAIEGVLMGERPDWVVVYGDTNTTLAGALAACKLHIPIAHVEAGLRSYNRRMPEEINRTLTDHAADLLFAPTEAAVENLRREGVAAEKIRLVGDVMYDAALMYGARARSCSRILDQLALEPKHYILATIHRAENTDDVTRLDAIMTALAELSHEMAIVFPVHPRTRKALAPLDALKAASSELRLIDPVGYLDMVALESNAGLIVTDSGGVQKEAFFHEVGCVTLRDETEWVELIALGWNRLLPPVSATIIASGIRSALAAPSGRQAQPYGSGNSAQLITRMLCRGSNAAHEPLREVSGIATRIS